MEEANLATGLVLSLKFEESKLLILGVQEIEALMPKKDTR